MTLSERRQSLDRSLSECAKAAGMGVAELSRIERGVHIPDAMTLARLGSVLGWTTDEVLASLPTYEEVQGEFEREQRFFAAITAVFRDAKRRG